MSFDRDKPFNRLPPLPPKTDVETQLVLKRAIAATRALAELKGHAASLPNQAMLINTLLLQEAKASSEIENIVTTNDALFRAVTSSKQVDDPATKEVLHYREALWHGYQSIQKRTQLNTDLFLEIANRITGNTRGIRNEPGIAIANARTREVIYTPPSGEKLIRQKLNALSHFLHNNSQMDPLVKLALAHYQFEAIHPFFDGNGRIGRIINILFLITQNLLDFPVLYLSKTIIDHKADYYARLRGVTERGEWEAWIIFMLEAIELTAHLTLQRILDIRALLDTTVVFAKKQLPPPVYSKELIELIFRQPYTKAQFLVDAGVAKRQTAAEYLKRLERLHILKSEKVGKENLYLNTKLYEILKK